MSGAGRPCGPPGMQTPDCGPPGNGSGGWMRSPPAATSYVVNSKIMVVAVAVLFAVVVFILCLHVYAKWFWRTQAAGAVAQQQQLDVGHSELGRQSRRMGSWRRRGRADARVRTPSAPLVVVQSTGLEEAVIEALPTFEFDGKKAPLECAVCLEDFEAGEKGRTLPKCGHHFHLDCVDMWLYSHSTCPLCRASARPDESKPIVDPATVTVPIDSDHPQPHPVIGDVQAPFMAAMRASRRQRQRSRGSSQLPTSPTSQQLPSIPSSDLNENLEVATEEPHETSPADPKALAREYEEREIPSNVLFWGEQSHIQPSASSIRAPFQVTIDIPRVGQRDALHPASVMSPMARASASFRRLLSRGKSVVSPHDDDGLDEGGPSSHSPRTPPGANS